MPELLNEIKNKARIEHWEQIGTKKKQCWIYYFHKDNSKIRYYNRFFDYKVVDNIYYKKLEKKLREIVQELNFELQTKGND